MSNNSTHGSVRFNKPVVMGGALSGAAIAIGAPLVTLMYGTSLGRTGELVVVILALVLGSGIAGMSAFFGAVMPASVEGAGDDWDRPAPPPTPPMASHTPAATGSAAESAALNPNASASNS